MNKKYRALTRLGVFFSFIAVIAFIVTKFATETAVDPLSFPRIISSEEDPNARMRYEWMRLRSPKSGEIPSGIRAKELAFASTLPTKESLAIARLNKTGDASRTQLYDWERKGPWNIGGRTRALALDVSDVNEQTILAGGVSGGMWRSTNGGITWTKTTGPTELHSVTALVQDTRPGKTDIWYYGTGEWRGNSASGKGNAFYNGNGIYRSTDGGQNWEQLASTALGTPHKFDQMFDYVWRIVIDPSNASEDELYAATYGGINRSTDGGVTWSIVAGEFYGGANYTDVAITSDGVLYAALSSDGSEPGILRSPDGVNWTNITPQDMPALYRRIAISIAPSNENIVYLVMDSEGSGQNDHSLWKFTYLGGDGSGSGGAWEDLSSNLPAEEGLTGNFDSQKSYDLLIAVKPDDENTVFIGGTNLYRSTDGFSSTANTAWIGGYTSSNDSYAEYTNHHADQHSLAFFPSSADVMLSGHDGGISKTTNNLGANVSWISLNNGYFTTQFYTVAIDHATSGSNVIIGGMQDNGTYFYNDTQVAQPWIDVFGGDGAFCAVADGRTYYYVSSQNGNLFRYELNAFGAWTSWAEVDPVGGEGYLFINPFILDPSNTNRMYLAGGEFIWRNSDLTQIESGVQEKTSVNWTKLTETRVVGESITALSMAHTPADRLYYGTHAGKLFRLDNAQTIGSTANEITGVNFPADAYVSSIAVDRLNGDNVMVVFSNYEVSSLFYSSDGGAAWTDVSGNLEESPDGSGSGPSTRWAVIHPTADRTVYFVGTSTGLYSTTSLIEASTNWVQEGASTIGNVVVDMIDNRFSDGLVVVATHGNGIFSSAVVTSVTSENRAAPADFSLEQNYPNPFNPETKIRFNLLKPEKVSLTVYNSIGQKVRTLLIDEFRSAGFHEIIFDGSNDEGLILSSGIYIYRLQAGRFSVNKRMLLLR